MMHMQKPKTPFQKFARLFRPWSGISFSGFRKPKFIYFKKHESNDGQQHDITYQIFVGHKPPAGRVFECLPRNFRIVRGKGEMHVGNILCSLDTPQGVHIVNFHPVIGMPAVKKKRQEKNLFGFLYTFEKIALLDLNMSHGVLFWHSYKRDHLHERALNAVKLHANGSAEVNISEALDSLNEGIAKCR